MAKAKKTNGKAAAGPKPEPMRFEYTAPEEKPYDRIAKRVQAAIAEVNAALKEAHESAEMRVFLSTRPMGDDEPTKFGYCIYRLTHSTIDVAISYRVADTTPAWRKVKDPAFKDAAGTTLGEKLAKGAAKRRDAGATP